MTHFAKLNSANIVKMIVVGKASDEGLEDELSARTGETYKQTSYNTRGGVHLLDGTPFRKNYAGIGFTYDEARDAFIPPTPYPSWVLEEDTCLWEAPVPMPDDADTVEYVWDEATTSWVGVD